MFKCKFEPKLGGLEVIVAFFVNCLDVLAGRFVQTSLSFALAYLLKLPERSGVLFALAAQTGFLNAEIVQLALISEEDLGFDKVAANVIRFGGEQFGEFEAAKRVDSHFERRNAQQSPFGIGKRLDEVAFVIGSGLKALDEFGDMRLIERGIIAGEQDGPAG